MNEREQKKQDWKAAITNGDVEDVIVELFSSLNEENSELTNDAAMLKTRHKQWEKDRISGVLSEAEKKRQLNEITMDTLLLIDNVPDKTELVPPVVVVDKAPKSDFTSKQHDAPVVNDFPNQHPKMGKSRWKIIVPLTLVIIAVGVSLMVRFGGPMLNSDNPKIVEKPTRKVLPVTKEPARTNLQTPITKKVQQIVFAFTTTANDYDKAKAAGFHHVLLQNGSAVNTKLSAPNAQGEVKIGIYVIKKRMLAETKQSFYYDVSEDQEKALAEYAQYYSVKSKLRKSDITIEGGRDITYASANAKLKAILAKSIK